MTLIVSLFASFNLAYSINVPRCGTSNISDLKGLIHKVGIIGAEDRATFEQYAKEKGLSLDQVKRMYSATGVLNCDGKQSTAQVTGSNRVITASAHSLFDSNCKKLKIKACSFFAFKEDGSFVEHTIDPEAIQVGGCIHEKDQNDWLIAPLDTPVDQVTPYRVPDKSVSLTQGTKILQVSAFSSNFKNRHITECTVMTEASQQGGAYKTDCDTGKGSSGSAHLLADEKGLILSGIIIASSEDRSTDRFNPHTNYAAGIPLSGKFLDTLKKAVKRYK